MQVGGIVVSASDVIQKVLNRSRCRLIEKLYRVIADRGTHPDNRAGLPRGTESQNSDATEQSHQSAQQ